MMILANPVSQGGNLNFITSKSLKFIWLPPGHRDPLLIQLWVWGVL